MQNFRTLGLRIKKVRDLFILSDEYGKIIRCEKVDKLAVFLTININIQYSSIFKVTVVAS